LVVPQDLDVGVPIDLHAAVKRRLAELTGLHQSSDEPSVFAPGSPDLLEVNFVGIDPALDPAEAYLLDDSQLPLLVFGALSLLSPGAEIVLGETNQMSPPASFREAPTTDGEKGERDSGGAGLDEVARSTIRRRGGH
jgi:hypothetical protein